MKQEFLDRETLKRIAEENNIEFPKNIPTDKLFYLLKNKNMLDEELKKKYQDDVDTNNNTEEQQKKKKMLSPKDGEIKKCIIRCLDPHYKMNVAEVGCNGYFLSAYLDKPIELNTFFIPTLLSARWDKPILDDNGQVKEIKLEPRFTIEYLEDKK